MGYILPEVYKSVSEMSGQELPKVFIETGTFKGGIPHRILETYKQLDDCFDKYYTIELGTDIAKIASRRYRYFEQGMFDKHMIHTDDLDDTFNRQCTYFNGKLTLINDDSVNALRQLLPTIDQSCCFWLDAHAGAVKYARGTVDVPLLQELEVIKNHPIKNHIIAIDDAHLLGMKQYDKDGNMVCDYEHLTFNIVSEYISSINPKYDIGLYEPYGMKMLIAYVK